jgi:hypothetical protein
MLAHITDLRHTVEEGCIASNAYTAARMNFHTDAGDIIALLCLESAKEGGESKIASSWTVYNELLRSRPDIIRVLRNDWIYNRWAYNSVFFLFALQLLCLQPFVPS